MSPIGGFAGTSGGAGTLLLQTGSGAGIAFGDYVSDATAPGLDTFNSYFVEVPDGLPVLSVQIFDADIGAGGAAAAHDQIFGGNNTSARYTLLDPTGAVSFGPVTVAPGACAGCNNNWVSINRAFVNFVGHGSSVAIGNQALFTVGYLDALTNKDRLPVVAAQTCLAGQFGFPGVESIGELLLLRPDRGAIAVWAPSGLSFNESAGRLGESFYRALFEDGAAVIGDAILNAQRRYAETDAEPYLLDIYNLVGDPATVLK